MKSQQLSFLRVIVNFQTFTFLFQKKLQTESGNDIIQVINKNVGEVSLVNKNSLYFSLKKAIHTFRLKSIFCRILVVLVVLILGICSLFYLVISSHYRESSQEHEINGNLAALNLIGNQMVLFLQFIVHKSFSSFPQIFLPPISRLKSLNQQL